MADSSFSPQVDDRRKVTVRLVILQVGVAVIFTALAFSFWYFQVVQNEKFNELAENNHQRTISLRAPRGVMYDRDLRPLVENRSSFTISIVREETQGSEPYDSRAVGSGGPRSEIRARGRQSPSARAIVPARSWSWTTRRWRRWPPCLRAVWSLSCRMWWSRKFRRAVIRRIRLRRTCSATSAKRREGQVESDRLQSGDIVGQAGVEKVYNKLLMGEDGARRVKVNSMGRELGMLEEIPAHEGRRVQLTIDADLQRAAEEGFKAGGFNGAAVVMDPRTGDVLAFTSVPGYDPNDFAGGIDRATWAALNTDRLKPLQNRAIQGRYSPGLDLQDRGGGGCAGRGSRHARLSCVLQRGGVVLWPSVPLLEKGRAWQHRYAPRAGAVVQRVSLHAGQHARRRQDS